MPSGFTHMLLAKTFPEKAGIKDDDLGLLLDSYMSYFQLGAIAPDLPYSQQLMSITGRKETKLADNFHYENTTGVPLKAFEKLKKLKGEERDQAFAFFLGFVAHIVADGIIHPYVRDKVGDYHENQNEHRMLEMRLDVFFLHELTKGHGSSLNLNYTNFHDQILDPLKNFGHISRIFADAISEVYGAKVESSDVEEWVGDMHTMLELAESSNNQYYAIVPGLKGYLFKDKDDVLKNHQDDLILRKNDAKKREINFAGRDVHFFDDCLPSFYKVFKQIAQPAYDFIYNDGPELNSSNFPAINLDTGRPLVANAGNDLDASAAYWELA